MCCCMIETSLVAHRKSSVIFENLQKPSENVRKIRLVFGTILENLQKSSESCRKYSENRQNRRY